MLTMRYQYILLWILHYSISAIKGFSVNNNNYVLHAQRVVRANPHCYSAAGLDKAQAKKIRTDTRLHVFGLLEDGGVALALDTFYQTNPYLAAFLTCSVKASAADWVAQSKQKEHNLPRNLAFILYGGLYQGCVQSFIYSVLFPTWFPDPSVQSILTQVGIDLFILGPLVCMPTVYTMKALFAGEEAFAGIEKYADHVQKKGILMRYWSIWGPVQTLNFGIIPHHLRVVFVAMVSFFWICLLSTVSSSASGEDGVGVDNNSSSSYPPQLTMQPIPVPVTTSHHQQQGQPQQQHYQYQEQ